MEVKLEILDNSYDYLENSLDTYDMIHEWIHNEDMTKPQDAAKFKITFVTLVQAVELLLKDILLNMYECLIYSNIDTPKETVSTITALKRINMYNSIKIAEVDVEFLSKCIEKRNQFMHYNVIIKTQEIKSKYLKLFELYKKIHTMYKDCGIKYTDKKYLNMENQILEQAKDFNVYRGQEFTSNQLEIYKRDLMEYQLYKYVITYKKRKI